MTADGGNPNLLWVNHQSKLHVIDQNLAFDEALEGFWDEHIFKEHASEWTDQFRKAMEKSMRSAMNQFPQWWQSMPAAWTEIPILPDYP